MFILVTYDVCTKEPKVGARRLRRVAKVCESYGIRVQNSVFECQVGKKEWVVLKSSLLKEINIDEDSLRFYFLDNIGVNKIEHHGIAAPPNLQYDVLVI